MRCLQVLSLCIVLALPVKTHAWNQTSTTRAAAVQEATELQQAGKLPEASAIWMRLLKADPQDVQAMVMLGVVSAQMKHYPEAESYYARALRLDPGNPGILLNLALAHFKATDLIGAIPILKEGCETAARQSPSSNTPGHFLLRHAGFQKSFAASGTDSRRPNQ